MHILVDLDDVLADFQGDLYIKYRLYYPNEPYIPLEEMEYDIEKQYLELFGKKYKKRVNEILTEPSFIRSLTQVEGGKEALEEIKKKKVLLMR